MKAAWRGIMPIRGDVVIVESDSSLRSLMVEVLGSLRVNAIALENADDALTFVLDSHRHCCDRRL